MIRDRVLWGCLLLPVLWGCLTSPTRARIAPAATPKSEKVSARSKTPEAPRFDIDPMPLLAADAAVAVSIGAGTLQVLAAAPAMEGDRTGAFLLVEQDACLLAFARGTPEIDDLDIVVFDDAGTPLAADQATDPKPAVVLCPPHPQRVYIASRVAAGHGLVGVGVHVVPTELAAQIAAVFGVHVASREEIFVHAWPGLEAAIARRRQALGGHWEDLRKVAATVNPRAPVYVSAQLQDSRCMDVLVVPSEETANLEVIVQDEEGHDLARAPNIGRDRAVLVCSPIDTNLTVSVRPHDGSGTVAVVLSKSAAGDQAALSVRPNAVRAAAMEPTEKIVERAEGMLARAGYDAKVEVARGTIETGIAQAQRIELGPGCSRVDVFSGAPVVGQRGVLWSSANEVIASGQAGEQLTLFGCVASKQYATLELTGIGRPGKYVIEQRTEKAPAPELMHHPLAASRVLGRANAAGRTVTVQDLNDIQRIDLDEGKRSGFDASVAVSTCMNAVVGTESGASGITLQGVEPSTGTIIGTARGHTVAQLRICARSRPLKVKVWAVVDNGKAEAVAVRYTTALDGS